jgi:hypothetical protein
MPGPLRANAGRDETKKTMYPTTPPVLAWEKKVEQTKLNVIQVKL